jgi:hypothetical protein
MCSSGDQTAKANEASQAAFSSLLQSSFSTAFGNNQAILSNLNTSLSNSIKNPTGFTPATLAAMRTGATDTTATQFENAEKSAGAVAASHGGDALPSGVSAQISGDIAQGAASQQSQDQNQISLANAQQQQSNYWNAISGLGTVANLENPTGYAGASSSAANSSTNAGGLLLQSQQAGWQDLGGVLSGIAGLGTAATGFVNANPGGIFGA